MRLWVEEAKRGDQAAWAELVRHFYGMGYAVAIAKLNDSSRAEDAAQDAFAEAFAKLDGLWQPEAFPGWFRTIVERRERICSDTRSKKSRPR
ncbi:sigma factor [Paenibacillus sp.]|uniref:RNA polymerase sigma factor n=1 Tax=Paenibacillus sp. TaxID=58172 RepID=UPI0028117610|nr:sigma factor [Paenibacillus sp.]